jgi:hypothetical protein
MGSSRILVLGRTAQELKVGISEINGLCSAL